MKRKIIVITLFVSLLVILTYLISVKIGVIITALGLLSVCCVALFLLMNKLVKQTNWWKNQYLATKQFVSGEGYRDNIIRNYDIINLGSNPAHYAFFYENVKGQSWATGSQGQDMDFEILKFYYSYLKKGGTVLIPIMPFTAISPFIKTRKKYWDIKYYSKFASIISSNDQVNKFPYGRHLKLYLKYPLIWCPDAIQYLFADVAPNTKYFINEQPMMPIELESDAVMRINYWKKEFCLKDLKDVLNSNWKKYYSEAINLNKKIVDFCIERDLKPVFICVPLTNYLSSKFPPEVKKYLIDDFVKECNVHKIPFLDYSSGTEYSDPSLFYNSFFLNLKGRKLFTNKVLRDLNII